MEFIRIIRHNLLNAACGLQLSRCECLLSGLPVIVFQACRLIAFYVHYKRNTMEISESNAAQTAGSSTSHSNAIADLNSRLQGGNPERRPSDSLIPDPNVLVELEAHARAISSNLDMALRDLRGSFSFFLSSIALFDSGAVHGISDLSLETMQVFGSVVNETCDSVDVIIRAMYTASVF